MNGFMSIASALLVGCTVGGQCMAQGNPQAPKSKNLGIWYDAEILNCDISIDETAGKLRESWKNCKAAPNHDVIVTPLRKIGPQSFKQDDGHKTSWHYKIAASGDLEVRDSQGVVRIIQSKGPK